MTATTLDFAARMETLKQIANVTGVRLPATIIPEGESLIPYGEERKRALKDDIYALPTITEVAGIIRAVREEQMPKDVSVPLSLVRMSPVNGGLYGEGNDESKALGYTPVAFNQAANVVKPDSVSGGFASTMLALPVTLRADVFNHFASTSGASERAILRTIRAPQRHGTELVLRRSVQAVVSERYSAVEDTDLLTDLGMALPEGARVRYTQTESRTDVEILWPAMSRELKVGDIALIGLQVTNSQTKQSSIRIAPKVLRVLCLNFTTAWSDGADVEVSIQHRGEARRKFAFALANALRVVEPFVRAFGDAYAVGFPTFAPTRPEVISRVLKAYELPTKFGDSLIASWDMDGERSAGNTLAGLSNAMTRAAQLLPMTTAAMVETSAGRLIRNGWAEIG